MRAIINISLPSDLNQEIEKAMRKGKYSTKSEFLRELIRERIAEEDLLTRLERSRKEIELRKGKTLKSLRDLR